MMLHQYTPSFMLCAVLAFTYAPQFAKGESASHILRKTEIKKKPNIILILADDVGTGDIPFYWNSSAVEMPNISRLSKMGVTFKDAHATPLCAPSRYMVLSGNYAHRGHHKNGSWNLASNTNQFLDTQKSIAQVLRDDAGYRTSMFGKWHLGGKAPNKTFSAHDELSRILTDPDIDWNYPLIQGPQDIGFDESYFTIGGIQAPPYSFFRDGYLTTNASEVTYWEEGSEHNMTCGLSKIAHGGEGDANWDSTAYNMIIVNETTKFIDNHLIENSSQPFFTYVALGGVHMPHSPPNQYLDGKSVQGTHGTEHLDLLYEMDKVVGSIISHIEDKGIAEETMIIFTSDNGGLTASDGVDNHHTSGSLRGSKNMVYEGGHRVPLIMRYDNTFPTNKGRNKLIGLNDLFATICDLVGAEVPSGSAQDSISFADYILEAGNNLNGMRNRFATWTYGTTKTGIPNNKASIRFGTMKLIHNIDESSFELYDLRSDISEQRNLAEVETLRPLMNSMYNKLKAEGPCPSDVKGKFKVEGLTRRKGCKWFSKRKKRDRRCTSFVEGKLHCASICGHYRQLCQKQDKKLKAIESKLNL